jgi:hypothetical protein
VSFDGGATYGIPKYRWRNGVVWLDGEMKNGTTGTTVFTLPAGYRPIKEKQFTVQSASANATVAVGNDGVVSVVLYSGSGNNSVSLNEVTFVAEQ